LQNPPPNTEQLRTFLVFAEHLNFVRTAAVLKLSQPAVHAQVAKLASHYDRPLYVRSGRSLLLTDAGRRVQGFAREILERSARFEQELDEADVSRTATLAAEEDVWLHLLAPAIGRGALSVQPRVSSDAVALEAVATGDADLAVIAGERPDDRFESAMLRASRRVLVVWADHPLARRDVVSIEDLTDLRLIAPPRGAPARDALEIVAAVAGVSLDVALDVQGGPLTLRFVEQGLGAAVVPPPGSLPQGLASVPIQGLPAVIHRVVRRAGALRSRAADAAWAALKRLSEEAPSP